MMCGCEGRNGGSWAHYVGQEKLRPIEGWARVMTGTDWQGGAKLQNSTSFYYFATDQWRNEEIDTAPLVSPDTTPRYRHPGDYNIMAARLGWLPAYPCFNKSGQKIFDEATAAGFEGIDGIRKFVAQSLKNRTLEFSWEDPRRARKFPA